MSNVRLNLTNDLINYLLLDTGGPYGAMQLTMPQFTFQLDGTFSLEDLTHLTTQVEKIGPDVHERMKAQGFTDRYDYDTALQFKAGRRFKGTVVIKVEEIASVNLPVSTPESVEDAA